MIAVDRVNLRFGSMHTLSIFTMDMAFGVFFIHVGFGFYILHLGAIYLAFVGV